MKTTPFPELPKQAGRIHEIGADLREPDRLIGSPDADRAFDSVPPDWDFFVLNILYDIFDMATTLPMIWEREVGRQERCTVLASTSLVKVSSGKPVMRCDAMPPTVASNFRQWLLSQIFISRSRNWYAEPLLNVFTIDAGPYKGRWSVLGLATAMETYTVNNPGILPIVFAGQPSDPMVSRRQEVAMHNPAALVNLPPGATW